MKKSLVLSALLATSMLAACGGNAPASNSNGGDSGNTPAKVAKLSYGLSSPAESSYHNMRQQYNYYLNKVIYKEMTADEAAKALYDVAASQF